MLLTTRGNGGGDFVNFGCRQNKDRVRRRLFESLEQGVERAHGEHVDLIDNIDFVLPFARRKIYFVAQVADVIYASVRGGVNFDQIGEAPFVDGDTIQASVTRSLMWIAVRAVEGFGHESRGGGLARAARPKTNRRARRAPKRARF